MKIRKSEILENAINSVLYLLALYIGSYYLLHSIKEFLFLEEEQHLMSFGWALVFMFSLFLIMMTLGYFVHLIFFKDKEKQDNDTQTNTKL